MEVSERARHELYEELGRQLGQERATTLMELLPRAGDEIATKRDLEALRLELTAFIHAEFTKHTRAFMIALVASTTANLSVALAAVFAS